ncbi:pyridoxamine 5'-phosphate oxidase family protein [Enorma burkinafasonensis]|uniref:pyridoxamine 5'-phosphate oxidase family protein n=1 Tax=Enorma burkinafasonensis TaxID=2590867 RepID=UPI0011A34780|nr:pyridoxamine 5'-phosphate oxidase family protein [Enorma burkinafasonensis]
MDDVLAYLKKNPTYFLATVDEEGNPQVRPFGTIAKFEGRLFIQTGKVKAVSRQMHAHPRIAICAADVEGGWLRIEADAVEDDRVEARQAVLDEYPDLQGMYAADDGNCEVFALENATATFCSFTAEPRTVTF